VHPRHFLDLRARIRAAFPLLSPISDGALLTILGKVSGGSSYGSIALVRLMPGHPVGEDGEPAPPDWDGMMPFRTVRGMAVPVLESERLYPAVQRAMAPWRSSTPSTVGTERRLVARRGSSGNERDTRGGGGWGTLVQQ